MGRCRSSRGSPGNASHNHIIGDLENRSFSAASFAGEEKKDKKDEKKGGHVLVYGEEKKDKKDEKKGGHMDDPKEEKKDEKGK
jgi:hypothetical protein